MLWVGVLDAATAMMRGELGSADAVSRVHVPRRTNRRVVRTRKREQQGRPVRIRTYENGARRRTWRMADGSVQVQWLPPDGSRTVIRQYPSGRAERLRVGPNGEQRREIRRADGTVRVIGPDGETSIRRAEPTGRFGGPSRLRAGGGGGRVIVDGGPERAGPPASPGSRGLRHSARGGTAPLFPSVRRSPRLIACAIICTFNASWVHRVSPPPISAALQGAIPPPSPGG